jgi:hypothetical protein
MRNRPLTIFPHRVGSYLDLDAIIIVHRIPIVKTLANLSKTYAWFRAKWCCGFFAGFTLIRKLNKGK